MVKPGDTIVHSGPLYAATETLIARMLGRFGVHWLDFPAGATREEIDAVLMRRPRTRQRRADLSRKPGQPDQRAGRCRGGRAPAATRSSRARQAADRDRQHLPRAALGAAAQAGRRHRRLLADQICRRPFATSSRAACSARKAHINTIRLMRNTIGTICDPNTAWMLLRSLETLELRMSRAGENAVKVCDFLARPPQGREGRLSRLPRGRHDARRPTSTAATAPARARPSRSI